MGRPLSAAQLARNRLGAAIRRGDPPEVIAEARRKVRELKAQAAIAAAEAEYEAALDADAQVKSDAMPDATQQQHDEVGLIIHPAGAANGAGN
jgi:hypothetical protein